jgi:Holliday junction resolvase RusA-like endonuclease
MAGRDVSHFRPLLTFTVRGEPIPQGSKVALPVRGQKGGRPIVVNDNDTVLKPWRRTVAVAAAAAVAYAQSGPDAEQFPLDGPLLVDVVFTMPKPQSAPKTRITYPAVRPDADKLLRAVLDSLTVAAVFVDDGRVVKAIATKAYPGEHVRALDTLGVHVIVTRYPLPEDVDLDELCPAPRRALPAADQGVLL